MPRPRVYRYEPLPSEWGRKEKTRWVEMVDTVGETKDRPTEFGINNDPIVRSLYHTVLYNRDFDKQYHADVIFTLRQYLSDEYGVDFDAVFDWAGYRRDYDQPAYSG